MIITLRDIYEQYAVSVSMARWAMQHHGPKPKGKIGPSHFWTQADLPAIEAALAKTAARSSDPSRRRQALEAAQ